MILQEEILIRGATHIFSKNASRDDLLEYFSLSADFKYIIIFFVNRSIANFIAT
jgi:hypothetical protein